ncbi:hypothetical protein GWN42_31340 [candidate division KSB1 bacterium]|nr:hypothetical protein [Phycisphaerae bacterium]NIQ92554.1 hypothetical protein [Deltaproteobacteria bacterium]NIV97164.1 hypothetical protein [candidate division KSB1 bacterium]
MFSGDPYIKISENGASIVVKGGQPVMDEGFENAVNISLFTLPGWFGNIFAENETERIGSEFTSTATGTITRTTLNDTRDLAQQELSWMIEQNIASEIDVNVSNPNSKNIQVEERIKRPSGDVETLRQTRYGQNWISQSEDPAHRKADT